MSESNFGGVAPLDEKTLLLLAAFRFTPPQKREVWEALKAHPDGVVRCACRAKAVSERSGSSGAGLLLTMIRADEHTLRPDPTAPRVTGWRFVRGTHSGTFVEDPNGVDTLPPGYDFRTRAPSYG